MYGASRWVYRVVVEKTEGKGSLGGKPRRKLKDNIRWIFRKLDEGT
jgi:hypothetical protein